MINKQDNSVTTDTAAFGIRRGQDRLSLTFTDYHVPKAGLHVELFILLTGRLCSCKKKKKHALNVISMSLKGQ